MHKLFVAVSAAAILAASSVAGYADEASGLITAIDPAAGTVTLADGKVFILPSSEDVAALQVGQQVTITYEESDGQFVASEVMPES